MQIGVFEQGNRKTGWIAALEDWVWHLCFNMMKGLRRTEVLTETRVGGTTAPPAAGTVTASSTCHILTHRLDHWEPIMCPKNTWKPHSSKWRMWNTLKMNTWWRKDERTNTEEARWVQDVRMMFSALQTSWLKILLQKALILDFPRNQENQTSTNSDDRT